MLVLTRKKDQKITITVPPSDKERVIEVTLVEVKTGYPVHRARIGFEADRDIIIVRDDAVKGERR